MQQASNASLIKHSPQAVPSIFALTTSNSRSNLSAVRVFLGHDGPELTLAPSAGLHYYQKAVWSDACNAFDIQASLATSFSQDEQLQQSCFVLSIAFYNAVEVAEAHVAHVANAMCLLYVSDALRADLQAKHSVMFALLSAKPEALCSLLKAAALVCL